MHTISLHPTTPWAYYTPIIVAILFALAGLTLLTLALRHKHPQPQLLPWWWACAALSLAFLLITAGISIRVQNNNENEVRQAYTTLMHQTGVDTCTIHQGKTSMVGTCDSILYKIHGWSDTRWEENIVFDLGTKSTTATRDGNTLTVRDGTV